MSSYLHELNEVQREAVTTTEGPVMVIAGPGSGKTRVLTYRVAHLIEEGIPPWNILALTFTNKAAREMKERIARVVGDKARKVWAGTFHSIFARILRMEAEKIGYPSDFTIYDTQDTKSVLKEIVQQMSLDKKNYKPNVLYGRISAAKSNLITPKLYERNDELMARDRMHRRPMLYKVYRSYAKRCKKAGAMDFDDLLLQMYRLLYENPDGVLEKYRKRFEYILVDEFQDTNYLQYCILKSLTRYKGSPENICIVGDDAQSIYAFRGATIENILDFEKDYPECKVFKLEQNYRSTPHIIGAANEVITYNRNQIEKRIWTDYDQGHRIQIVRTLSDKEEGQRVADMILEQKNRHHLHNSDIAILYRTNAQSRVFEEYLRKQNISYKVFGGLSFYKRKEVKDLLAYLRLAINPKDQEALKRVINYPKRGIGKKTMGKLMNHAHQHGITLWESIARADISSRVNKKLREFRKMVKSFIEKAKDENAYKVAMYAYEQSGIYDELKKDTSIEGVNRLENVESLLDGIKEFVEDDEVTDEVISEDKSLNTYLQNIALLTDLDEETEGSDYVTLMSVHAAKGLEFKSVFIVGLEENLFPSYQSMGDPESLDEERRLFYVAITRAKEFLTLTYANSRYHHGKMRYNDPSRFLDELPAEHVETDMKEREQPKERKVRETSAVKGTYKKKSRSNGMPNRIDPSEFEPSAPYKIKEGMNVLHMKFGRGRVKQIDGANENRVATIYFDEIDRPRRRIMLKFAKLQIMDKKEN